MDALVTVDDGSKPARVVNADQLQSTFRHATDEARVRGLLNIAFVTVPAGHVMGIVLGGDESALSFTYDHRNPPYLASRGVATAVEPVLTCYVSYSHHTEFPRHSVIPYGAALAAVQEFAASGSLPGCVQWVET
jgi:Immunity protein Imm1